MSVDFHENFTLVLPNVETKLHEFVEGDFKNSHGLIVEIAAIHSGLTGNYNHYSSEHLEMALNSWTAPYAKPILLNHDPMSEPVGRVIGARMEHEADGTPYTKLQVAITDPVAMQKVADKRYLTGSVGGQADESICSVCNTDWANPKEGARGLPCVHQRGKVYNGKLAFLDMKNIKFKEYSFVNMPGDQLSGVRNIAASQAEEAWVQTPRFFVLDMNQEGIVEYTESENKDVLADMRKKDASPLYLGLKGAFLSAIATENETEDGVNTPMNNTNAINENSEENQMAEASVETKEENDDILAVTDELSADLSKVSEDDQAAEEATAEEVTEEAPVEETTDETSEAEADVAAEETADETVEENEDPDAEEAERPQAQEKPAEKDVDAETSEGAPVSRENDETAEQEAETVEQANETELNEEDNSEVVEPLVEELKSRVEALEGENAKLKKALHRTLAERVVEAKIRVGVIEADERKAAIDEHAVRTASSLADTLRDLAKMPAKQKQTPDVSELEMTNESQVVGAEANAITIGEDTDSEVTTSDPVKKAENLFVEALMGRKKL